MSFIWVNVDSNYLSHQKDSRPLFSFSLPQCYNRQDFRTLLADVSLGEVGAVLALEASRLARSNTDWYRLIELCSLTGTLLLDEDGCYDPADFNDALLLGLK